MDLRPLHRQAVEAFQRRLDGVRDDQWSAPTWDILGDDPRTAFRKAAAQATDALQAPGAMERTVHASFGDISAAHSLAQLLTATVRTWDLAVATGQLGRDPREASTG